MTVVFGVNWETVEFIQKVNVRSQPYFFDFLIFGIVLGIPLRVNLNIRFYAMLCKCSVFYFEWHLCESTGG